MKSKSTNEITLQFQKKLLNDDHTGWDFLLHNSICLSLLAVNLGSFYRALPLSGSLAAGIFGVFGALPPVKDSNI